MINRESWLNAISDSTDIDLITMYGCCNNGNIQLLGKLAKVDDVNLLGRLIAKGFMTQDVVNEIVKRFGARAGVSQ